MPAVKDKKEFWTDEKKRIYENAMILLIKKIETIDDEIYQKTGNHKKEAILRHSHITGFTVRD